MKRHRFNKRPGPWSLLSCQLSNPAFAKDLVYGRARQPLLGSLLRRCGDECEHLEPNYMIKVLRHEREAPRRTDRALKTVSLQVLSKCWKRLQRHVVPFS